MLTFFGICIIALLFCGYSYKESNRKYEEYFEEMYNDIDDWSE